MEPPSAAGSGCRRARASTLRSPDAWEFPVGTRLWKEFAHGRALETRYIERAADGNWRFGSYVWNADGSDAVLAPAAGLRDSCRCPSAPGARYTIPSENDCRACHEGAPVAVLGFSALQLSPDRDPLAPHAERLDRLGRSAPARRARAAAQPAARNSWPIRRASPRPTRGARRAGLPARQLRQLPQRRGSARRPGHDAGAARGGAGRADAVLRSIVGVQSQFVPPALRADAAPYRARPSGRQRDRRAHELARSAGADAAARARPPWIVEALALVARWIEGLSRSINELVRGGLDAIPEDVGENRIRGGSRRSRARPSRRRRETGERQSLAASTWSTRRGCHDCHTPFKMTETGPARDMERMLSGHPEQLELPPAPPANGPWLVSMAAHRHRLRGSVGRELRRQPDAATRTPAWASGPRAPSSTRSAPAAISAAAAKSCRPCPSRCTRTSPTRT